MTPKEFAEVYAGLLPIIRRQHSPKKRIIEQMVEAFERDGIVVSPDGIAGEVIMKWLRANNRCYNLMYHAGYRALIVRAATETEIEEFATPSKDPR